MKNAIISLDPNILNPETASSLIGFIPETEDINIAKDYDGTLETLGNFSY